MMRKKIAAALVCMLLCAGACMAQDTAAVYSKFASQAGRKQLVQNLTKNSIDKCLNGPLADSTEDDWKSAFWAMELLQYKVPWAKVRISLAFDSIEKRSIGFQRALLECCYTNFGNDFTAEVAALKQLTADEKIFAMCCEYLLKNTAVQAGNLKQEIDAKFPGRQENPILKMLLVGRKADDYAALKKLLPVLLGKNFLPGRRVVYSLQRKNRNYPGIVLVRDSAGNFVRDDKGGIFYVPQLARSITNLPGYLTNGNTPQGIFCMQGFEVSRSNFIGPTPNIQLTMPFETSIKFFLKDSTVTDTVWTPALYKRLLPAVCQNYFPLMGSYYASQAGRTEVIAHGTTIDPAYYKGASYWPHTPTLGCLCTKELWDAAGKRTESNQQRLVNAVKKAGGADGYLIVLELDDKQLPVSVNEVMAYMKSK
jgi:hypothetical protein